MPPKKSTKKKGGNFFDDIAEGVGSVAHTAEGIGRIVQTGAELAPLLGLGRKVKSLEERLAQLERTGHQIPYNLYANHGSGIEIAGHEEIAGQQKIAGRKRKTTTKKTTTKKTTKQKKVNLAGGSALYNDILSFA